MQTTGKWTEEALIKTLGRVAADIGSRFDQAGYNAIARAIEEIKEFRKLAAAAGEKDDPFAAWETIEPALLAENDRLEARLADLEAEARQLRADKGTLSAEVEQLRNLIGEAADQIADWGAYAAQYFREKHDLEGTVKRFRAIAKGPE